MCYLHGNWKIKNLENQLEFIDFLDSVVIHKKGEYVGYIAEKMSIHIIKVKNVAIVRTVASNQVSLIKNEWKYIVWENRIICIRLDGNLKNFEKKIYLAKKLVFIKITSFKCYLVQFAGSTECFYKCRFMCGGNEVELEEKKCPNRQKCCKKDNEGKN